MRSQGPDPSPTGMAQATSLTPSEAVTVTRSTSRPSSAGGSSSVRLPTGDVEHPGFAETEDQEDDEVAERGDREQSQESGHAG